jgi:hypothetical protein
VERFLMSLTGLFSRGSSYYLRVMLPAEHPATATYRSGKVVLSLGARSHRDAVATGTLLRAEVLRGTYVAGPAGSIKEPALTAWEAAQAVATVPALPPTQAGSHRLRFVFDQWMDAKPRSADSASACRRALEMYESQTGDPRLGDLTRAMGVRFRSWLLHRDRKTASKTARDRLTWVKSLLKFAYLDLELIPRNPWEGLDIEHDTSAARRPWSPEELQLLFRQPLHSAIPTARGQEGWR